MAGGARVVVSSKAPGTKTNLEHLKTLVLGGLAGMLSRTCVSPLERIKILHQVQHVAGHQGVERKYAGLGPSLVTMFREEGFRGLFRGNGANCIRVFPYVGTQFLCFDLFASHLFGKPRHNVAEPKRLSTVEKLFTGGLAGICSVLVTYPLDFARGRLTSQGGLYETRYRGVLHCIATTVREEGPRAVYRGIAPTLIGIGPYVLVHPPPPRCCARPLIAAEGLKETARLRTLAYLTHALLCNTHAHVFIGILGSTSRCTSR